MIDALSNKITYLIKQNVKEISEEKEEIINYGLNILIYQAALTTIILLIALLTGLFKYVAVAVLVYASLRVFAGGAHARTRLQCSVSSIVTMLGSVLLSKYIWADSYIPAVFVLIINLVIVYVYAPGDTVERPIISKKIRLRQKAISLILVTLIFITSVIVWHFDKAMYNVVNIASLLAVFMLTPVSYNLFKCKRSCEEIDINTPN